jgi:hypothetical protein
VALALLQVKVLLLQFDKALLQLDVFELFFHCLALLVTMVDARQTDLCCVAVGNRSCGCCYCCGVGGVDSGLYSRRASFKKLQCPRNRYGSCSRRCQSRPFLVPEHSTVDWVVRSRRVSYKDAQRSSNRYGFRSRRSASESLEEFGDSLLLRRAGAEVLSAFDGQDVIFDRGNSDSFDSFDGCIKSDTFATFATSLALEINSILLRSCFQWCVDVSFTARNDIELS